MAGIKNLPVYNYSYRADTASTARPVKATVYPKAGGKAYTGYVIDGKTYKDPYGNERIDHGSRVELSDGRTYIYNRESGGVPDYATTMSEYEKTVSAAIDGYRQSGKKNDVAVDAAVKNTINGLKRNRSDANELAAYQKEDARRRYVEASNPYGPIGQRLEALGLGDSGYAETTYARLGNEYQNAVSSAEKTRAETLRDIDAAISRAYYDGEIEKAKAWQELEREIMGYSVESGGKLADMRFDAARAAADDERWQQEWAYKALSDAVERDDRLSQGDFERALALIKLGVSNEDIAATLGITPAQAAAIAYRESGAGKKSTSTSSSKKSTGTKTTAEKTKLTDEQLEKNKGDFYRLFYAIARDEGLTKDRERKELFYSMLDLALEKGYLTPKYASQMSYK